MFSIDYGIGGGGAFGFLLIGLMVGVALIAAIWLVSAVRGAQHIVEDEPHQPTSVQPPVEPHD